MRMTITTITSNRIFHEKRPTEKRRKKGKTFSAICQSLAGRRVELTYIHRGDYQIGQYFDQMIRSSWNLFVG